MDEWGRGPWFDPNAPESDDPGETQVIKPRTSGGPRPDNASAPGGRTPGASAPMNPRPNADDWGDLDALAASQGANPDVSAEGSMRPRPTLSRPLYPPEPWNAYAGPTSGRFAPLSRPLDDVSQPLGLGGMGVGGTGTAGPGGPNQRGRGNERRRGRSVLALLLLLFMVALLVGGIGFVLINSPFKTAGTSTATATPTVMGTPTDTPSPTPIPPPTAATVTLSPATKQLTSAGSMTSCPTGCDLVGNSYSHSENHTGSGTATYYPQSALTGTIMVTNSGPGPWVITGYQFQATYNAVTYKCAPQDITLPAGPAQPYFCFLGYTSPSSIPANTFVGTANASSPHVTYSQPSAMTGNAHYTVLQSDCDAVYGSVEATYNQTWANNWMASQSVPSGWVLVYSQPKLNYSNFSCPAVNQNQPTSSFDASLNANVNDAAYNPGASQSLAGSRRDNLLPSGYLWKSGSRTGCTPNVTNVASNNHVTLNCSASGTAYVNWTDSLKASLAAAVAGKLKTAALDVCNKHTGGVVANSCSISITGGDGTLLPASASVVTINVKAP